MFQKKELGWNYLKMNKKYMRNYRQRCRVTHISLHSDPSFILHNHHHQQQQQQKLSQIIPPKANFILGQTILNLAEFIENILSIFL